MKLVMSYRMDRLGNSLLETVLIKLGFHSNWRPGSDFP